MGVKFVLPILAAIALAFGSASAWGAAGVIGDPVCCCPAPKICKCHDHHDDPSSEPTLKRCAGGANVVYPELAIATLVAGPEETVVVVSPVVSPEVARELESRIVEPESPPF